MVAVMLVPSVLMAQTVYTAPKADIDKIRDEGMNRSQVMQTLSYLTDVIGPRLTNSPNMKRANEWTRDTMAKWGMQNAHLESWGPFGRGWALDEFSATVTAPTMFPVIAFPKAWSTSTKGTVTSEVVLFDAKSDADLAKFKGKLKGKIVLVSPIREVKAIDMPLSTRYTDDELAKMAAEQPQGPRQGGNRPAMTDEQRAAMIFNSFTRMNFLKDEGAAVIVDSSPRGSGGTIFVQGASAVQEMPKDTSNMMGFFRGGRSVYKKENEQYILPQVTLATEDYNRIARMIGFGVSPTMSINIKAKYYDQDEMGYDTIAEIPGTDPKLKSEVVMLGGHLDSWHSATGATDNAAGSAVAMEAARIIMASGLKPRRTIRVGLWSGEEQGLNGSRGYVAKTFGEMKGGGNQFGPRDPNAPKPELVKLPAYDNFSAYYNLDNGTGTIRGVYLQGNEAVRPYFQAWLAPFADLGAKTLTISNTGGTDHLSFDAIGLPGFQFIQDEVEYSSRTHHSNQDNFDRIQAKDMMQSATIMAAFVYQTAMMDEKMPRKPMQ